VKPVAAAALALALALAWVYADVRNHEFLRYDDDLYILEDASLRAPFGPSAVVRAFTTPYDTNWFPLTTLSWHLDATLFGFRPGAFLVENVVLHALSAALLLLALHALTGALLPSAFAAGVFALHPLHVETVAWAIERKGVLSGLCFHAALLAYARTRSGRTAAAFGAGMLAKQSIAPLPAVLVLLDFWPRGKLSTPRDLLAAIASKWLLFVVAIGGLAVAFVVQREGGAVTLGDILPLDVRLANAVLSIAAYLGDAVWPAGLAAFYPHPEGDVSRGAALGVAALLALFSYACWRAREAQPWWLVGWLWFLGLLLPTLGLVQVGVQSRADRYTYLPLTGLAIAVAWSAARFAGASRVRQRACAAAGAALLLACAVVSRQQVAVWRDTETLFRHATSVTRGNFIAEHSLASELLLRGDARGAEQHFAESVRLRPGWPEAHFGLGDALAAEGRFEEAIRRYEHGLRLGPRYTRGHIRLARALLTTGRVDEALGRARFALQTAKPRERGSVFALIAALQLSRDEPHGAQSAAEQAIALEPELAEAHATRGLALLTLGQAEQGYASLRRALELGGPAAPLQLALGDASGMLGRPDEARAHYQEAQRAAQAAADPELEAEAARHLAAP
jgi:tetratricopeptide (TPR) repeat protein